MGRPVKLLGKQSREKKEIKAIRPFIDAVKDFISQKPKLDSLKKEVDELNKQIKEQMIENKLNEFVYEGMILTMSKTQKTEIDERKAINKLKSILSDDHLQKVVKTKEYLDEEAVENLIFNGDLTAEDLSDCIIEKDLTYTLKLKAVKKEKK